MTARVPRPPDGRIEQLRKYLAHARAESDTTIGADLFTVLPDVRALVESDPRPWWEALDLVETFLLFEMSPATAARAPAEVRANAWCAGVEHIKSEWWSVPGDPDPLSTRTQRLVSSNLPVTGCLVAMFDSTKPLDYSHGETFLASEQYRWTLGDLAAGMVALMLKETYHPNDTPEERAAHRASLRAKLGM